MPKIENNSLNLLFRADASVRGGTGHVMRCLALAQACEASGGSAQFLIAQSTPSLDSRLREAGISVARGVFDAGSPADARETMKQAGAAGSSWIVADGYDFGSAWQKEIKAAQLRLLLLDDYGHAEHYSADIVLNQNLHAQEAAYKSREPFTRLLLGPRFSLLRDEFVKGRNAERRIPDRARKILVTLGGSDPDNVTYEVIKVVATIDDIEITVVVGGSNPHLPMLRELVANLPAAITVMPDAQNMPDLMERADIAVVAGGTTSWELAFSGLPSVVITLADNQEAISAELDRAGLAISIGRWSGDARARLAKALADLLLDVRRREQMSDTGRQLVDGFGVQRVLARMNAAHLHLRAARSEDCRLVWEWANDAEARAASFSSESIKWDIHRGWYANKLTNPNCFFYIVSDARGTPMGQIRFELGQRRAVVSISVAKETRGKGQGAALIVRGLNEFFESAPADTIDAYVKPDNKKSIKTFLKADFIDAGDAEMQGQKARHFVFHRDCL